MQLFIIIFTFLTSAALWGDALATRNPVGFIIALAMTMLFLAAYNWGTKE